jgi:hypothetical protein
MILESLPIARLRFDLTTQGDAEVPAYKGDMLRMALLWWLSEYWCTMPERCSDGCPQPNACLFGRLIEPRMDPAWPLPMQRLIDDTPPPAYALWDDQDRRRMFVAGTHWHFELTLVGELALCQIPAVVAEAICGQFSMMYARSPSRCGCGGLSAARPTGLILGSCGGPLLMTSHPTYPA